ncbi:MAG TPA: hypothetical protein VGI86_06300, partial [Acidimicrobiia bacterium]
VFYNMDISNPKHLTLTQMVSADDHNDFGRTSTANPKFEFQTQATLKAGAHYLTLPAFVTASGREKSSTSTDGMALASIFTNPDAGDYSVQASVLPQLAAPAALPTAVAAAMNMTTTPAVIGAT